MQLLQRRIHFPRHGQSKQPELGIAIRHGRHFDLLFQRRESLLQLRVSADSFLRVSICFRSSPACCIAYETSPVSSQVLKPAQTAASAPPALLSLADPS